MLKNIAFHALVGGALFIVGAWLYDFAHIKPAAIMVYGGMVYAAASIILLILGVKLPSPFPSGSRKSFLEKTIRDRNNRKAREELLGYKKLLNENIISKEEFESKAKELRKMIL